MLRREIPMILSSSTAAGASNKSSDGSTFYVYLDEPIRVHSHATNCYLQVEESTVWWVMPNISATLGNNKFYLKHLTIDYVLTVPDGLYSLTDLNSALDRLVENAVGVGGLFTIEADDATQKVNIEINQAGTQINFTLADTLREVLGFNSQLVPAVVSTGIYNQLGDDIARFNAISYFLIHSDLADRGMRLNNVYSQAITQVLIDNVETGSQIVARPYNPPKIECIGLVGAQRTSVKVWLTDQDGNTVNTNGEDYAIRLTILYDEPPYAQH